MALHFRRIQLRRNLLEMYRDNALRSQSYMDTVRLHMMMATMTEVETKRYEEKETHQLAVQGELFPGTFDEHGNKMRHDEEWVLSIDHVRGVTRPGPFGPVFNAARD